MQDVTEMLKNAIISFAIGAVVLFGITLIVKTMRPI